MKAGSLRSRVGGWTRGLAERHGGTPVLIALCAVVAVGVGLRAYYALEKTDGVQEDSIKYYDMAEALYLDHRYDSPQVERDDSYHPGSPLFHSGIWFLTGGVNPEASRLAAALLSALMIVCVYLLARRLVGPETRAGPLAGLGAAAAIAIYPSSIDFYRSHMNEPLASVALTAAVLAFLWADERGTVRAWALPAALLGISALFRPEVLALGAALGIVAILRAARRSRTGWATAAVFALAFLLPILPWTIRNAITLDRFVPISTGGGNAVYVGSYIPGNGDHFDTFARRVELLADEAPGLTPAQRVRVLAQSDLTLGDVLEAIARDRHPDLPSDQALSRLGRDQLVDGITGQPLDYTGMLAEKAWNMWGNAAASKPRQGEVGEFGQAFHFFAVVLGLAGLILLAVRCRWEAAPLAVLIGGATLIGMVLLAPPRRAVDLLPLVSALAAYAVASATVGRHWVRGSMSSSLTLSR